MENFLSISIIGVIVSGIIELVTRIADTRPLVSKFVAVGVSLVIGTGYYFLSSAVWFPTVLTILAIASAVHALFLTKNK